MWLLHLGWWDAQYLVLLVIGCVVLVIVGYVAIVSPFLEDISILVYLVR